MTLEKWRLQIDRQKLICAKAGVHKGKCTDQIGLEAWLSARGPANPCKHGKPSRQDDNYSVCTVAWWSIGSAPVKRSIQLWVQITLVSPGDTFEQR